MQFGTNDEKIKRTVKESSLNAWKSYFNSVENAIIQEVKVARDHSAKCKESNDKALESTTVLSSAGEASATETVNSEQSGSGIGSYLVGATLGILTYGK